MIKMVITKNRDIIGEPTLFLDDESCWNSVSNKAEFQAIADKVKIEFKPGKATELLAAVRFQENVKVNLEMSPKEYFDFI